MHKLTNSPLRWAALLLLAGTAACQQVTTTSNASQPAADPGKPVANGAAPAAAAAAPQAAGAKPTGPAAPEAAKPASIATAPPMPAPPPPSAPSSEAAQSAEAPAQDRRVRIINNTGQMITLIKGSPSNDSDWGADRIPSSVLAAGDSVLIDFDDGNDECVYDLQATLSDGSLRVAPRANVCRISEWTVTAEE